MSKYLAVYDREDGWQVVGLMPGRWVQDYTKSGRKAGLHWEQDGQFYYGLNLPEAVSCFVQAHRVIDAETKEDACQSISTFPQPLSETLLPSR